MDVTVIWNAREWAEAVAALPVEGPLPCRTVLVPRERVAHVLRRELIQADLSHALAGTRFVIEPYAAVEVLRAGDVEFEPGEEDLRRARLMAIFRSGIQLGYFSLDLLRDKPGWDEAFAHTISDLEGAGLQPVDVESACACGQLRDVAAIWRALDESAGNSWTIQRILLEASRALDGKPALWPFHGSVLAFATGDATVAEARFVRAIPRATLGLIAARPVRESYLNRLGAMFGEGVESVLRSAGVPRNNSSERDLLASFLFEPPSVLADESRPVSNGPDGTVDVEEHAGVEEEVEATADWVARQVAAGIALEDIAVLTPTLDPLAGLVAERLARLPWQNGPLPVFVAGGLPLLGFAGGARALAVVSALRAHLAAEALADVLPALRSSAPDGRHLSRGAAMDLVWSLGTVGGNMARPQGALEWFVRASERVTELEAELARAREAEEAAGGLGRRAREVERLLADLCSVRPALEALVEIARQVVDGDGLSFLWAVLREFLGTWLLQPGEGPRVQALLDERLAALASDEACGILVGDDALRVIEDAVASARITLGRFGEPAVYVGTVREAVGLRFRAVRVIGLTEGHLPSVSREDPVVPDVLRDALKISVTPGLGATPPTAADKALQDLHALDIAIRNASERVALSAARLDVERTQREPSSVILEAAAALGRPNQATGERGPTIPDATTLRRDGFAPARDTATRFRVERPLGEAAWQYVVARGSQCAPGSWRGARFLDLERIENLMKVVGPRPIDGILGTEASILPVPGLTGERPISPSALETLLGCPHAFLLGNVLGFDEPATPPPQREIGQPYYGNLFHAVAAEFYERHGTSFCSREDKLIEWKARADEIVDRAFDNFLRQYPLVGEAVRFQQRERLRRDLHELLSHDWESSTPGRLFVAAERVFGRPNAVRISLGERSVYVRGRIDRLDVEGKKLLVRDLKTGHAHPRIGREEDPDPGLDLQIAVYGLVSRILADRWKVPKEVAASYVYVGRGGASERSYRDDFHATLEPEGRRWLRIAAALLDARLFPRSPNVEDCSYCCFRPVCGVDSIARARALLANTDLIATTLGADVSGTLAEFAALKGVASAGNEED